MGTSSFLTCLVRKPPFLFSAYHCNAVICAVTYASDRHWKLNPPQPSILKFWNVTAKQSNQKFNLPIRVVSRVIPERPERPTSAERYRQGLSEDSTSSKDHPSSFVLALLSSAPITVFSRQAPERFTNACVPNTASSATTAMLTAQASHCKTFSTHSLT